MNKEKKLGLFIDTSYYLVLGLYYSCNGVTNWTDYQLITEAKTSALIHKELYGMLERNNLAPEKIKEVLTVAGPGSYTGMRISHGMAQIFELLGRELFSFYHFEVPQLLGTDQGVWVANAFKNELFVYGWRGADTWKELISDKEIAQYLTELVGLNSTKTTTFSLFTHFKAALPASIEGGKFSFQDTSEMIKTKFPEIYQKVTNDVSSKNKPPYYYRPLDKEFRKFS